MHRTVKDKLKEKIFQLLIGDAYKIFPDELPKQYQKKITVDMGHCNDQTEEAISSIARKKGVDITERWDSRWMHFNGVIEKILIKHLTGSITMKQIFWTDKYIKKEFAANVKVTPEIIRTIRACVKLSLEKTETYLKKTHATTVLREMVQTLEILFPKI